MFFIGCLVTKSIFFLEKGAIRLKGPCLTGEVSREVLPHDCLNDDTNLTLKSKSVPQHPQKLQFTLYMHYTDSNSHIGYMNFKNAYALSRIQGSIPHCLYIVGVV